MRLLHSSQIRLPRVFLFDMLGQFFSFFGSDFSVLDRNFLNWIEFLVKNYVCTWPMNYYGSKNTTRTCPLHWSGRSGFSSGLGLIDQEGWPMNRSTHVANKTQ